MTGFTHYAIPALWLAWLIYWGVAAFGAKPTSRLESWGSRLSHIVPLTAGILLLSWRDLAVGVLHERFLSRAVEWFWLGFFCVVAGLGLSVLARIWLGGNWSGMVELKQDHELIRSGPYRWTRHPIYTGLLLAILGTAIATGEWRGPAALVLVTVAFLRKIAIEERYMTEQFGAAYVRYRAEVPALIPFFHRSG